MQANDGLAGISKGLLAGTVAGATATVVMTAGQMLLGRLMRDAESDAESGSGGGDEPATAKAAGKIGRTIGRELSPEARQHGGNAVHYGFGTLIGALYGAAAEVMPRVTTGMGLPFGTALMIGADEVAVPALRLSPPPTALPLSTHVYALLAHAIYGTTAELVRREVRARL